MVPNMPLVQKRSHLISIGAANSKRGGGEIQHFRKKIEKNSAISCIPGVFSTNFVCFLFNTFLIFYSTVFQLYRRGQFTYPCFPGVLLTSTQHKNLSKPVGSFPRNHWRNDERGINPVAMTVISSQRKYLPRRGSNQPPPVLKSATLPTGLRGSANR